MSEAKWKELSEIINRARMPKKIKREILSRIGNVQVQLNEQENIQEI